MKFRVTSTAGHTDYVEEYNGTYDDFVRFKFGSEMAMMDRGQAIQVLADDPVVEEPAKPARKKKVENAVEE